MDERIVVLFSLGLWLAIMAAFVIVMAGVVNVVNTYRDCKLYRKRCELLHDKLDRVTQERMDAQATVAAMEVALQDAYAALQRQRTASNWARSCEADDYAADIKRQETINETIKRAKRAGKKETKENA